MFSHWMKYILLISSAMKHLVIGNEIIYYWTYYYLRFDWSWNIWNLMTLDKLKFYSSQLTIFLFNSTKYLFIIQTDDHRIEIWP